MPTTPCQDHFYMGLERLITFGRAQRCVMMCSEAVWWRCNRRIVTDHLIARGEWVFHLTGHNRIEAASMTKGARVLAMGTATYPTDTSGE